MKPNNHCRRSGIVTILLAGLLSAGILTSCQGSSGSSKGNNPTTSGGAETSFNETGFPIVNKKITQKMTIIMNASYKVDDVSKMYFFEQMEKKTNVSFTFEKITTDQWKERKSLLFAANDDLPDILAGAGTLTNTDVITYAKAGQLLPLNDLMDKYAPDYVKCLDQFKESAQLYAPDGKMYGLTSFTGGYAEMPGSRAFINEQWIKNLGMKHPTTFDELYDVLVAFRDKDPDGNGKNDTIPLCGYATGYAVDPFVAGPIGISFGWTTKDRWQIINDKLVYVAEHPNYKLYLENMNKLYSQKLLDQEYYTQNDAQYSAKGANMQIGACTCAAPFVVTKNTDPAIYEQYDIIGPLTSDVFKEKKWYGQNVSGQNIFLTTNNKNPEISLRYLNELYTEDGAWLLVGPEKGEWQADTEEGRVWNSDKTKYTYAITGEYSGTFAWINTKVAPVGGGFHGFRQFSKAMEAEQMAQEDIVLLESLKKNQPYMTLGSPALFFTPEELEKIKLVETSINTYCDQMEAKIVMGEEPLSSYDAMVKELKQEGLEDLTKIYNQAYDRYKSSIKK